MESGWSSGLDLFLDLDRGGGPGRGIEHGLRAAIRAGRLTPETTLPSSRSLARELQPPAPCPQAIVIGYGTPAGHAYRPALRALTQLMAGQFPD